MAVLVALSNENNAFQHSRSSTLNAVIFLPEHLRVSVRDDGQGIEPQLLSIRSVGHWRAASGMRERAEKIEARLRISSPRAGGTEIELMVLHEDRFTTLLGHD